MKKRLLTGLGVCLVSGMMLAPAPAQEPRGERLGERLGEKLDRGLEQLTTELRRGWAEVRQTVERMGVQGRVYSRLRWDKAIENAPINIEVRGTDEVVLRGTVASEAVRQKAVQLARDTVGVSQVVDELTVTPPE